jgi:hypothetical protein
MLEPFDPVAAAVETCEASLTSGPYWICVLEASKESCFIIIFLILIIVLCHAITVLSGNINACVWYVNKTLSLVQ